MSAWPGCWLLTTEHGKAGKVCRLILDVGCQYVEFVTLGGQTAGDGGDMRVSRGQRRGARVTGCLFDGHTGQVCGEPAPALGEGLGMSQHAPNLFQPRRTAQ